MRSFILSILIFPLLLSAQDINNKFSIEGEVLGEKNKGKISLHLFGSDEVYKTKVKDGTFIFEGEIPFQVKGWFVFDKILSIPFYIENGSFKLKLRLIENDKKLNYHLDENWTIEGIEGNITEQLSRDYSIFESEYKQDLRYNYLLYNYLNQKVSEYPNNKLYFDIIFNFSRRQQYLTYSQLISLIGKMDLNYLDSKTKLRLVDNIEKSKNFGIGKRFPHSLVETTNGRRDNITNSFGKFTLVDFWASWCAPCRAKNPKIKAIYKEYKSKGFEVIGVSTDRDKSKWKLAIQKDDLPWKNFHTSTLNRELDVTSIPYTYLLDEEGTIVGVNLTEQEIKFILDQRLE